MLSGLFQISSSPLPLDNDINVSGTSYDQIKVSENDDGPSQTPSITGDR